MKLRGWLFLDKTGTCVEQGIPWDVRVGSKRDAVVPALLRLDFGGLHERPPPTLPRLRRRYGQLLQVAQAVDLENMNKPANVTVVELDDKDEAGLRRTSSSRGGGSPTLRLECVDQELVGIVFNLLDDVEVSRSRKANSG